MRWDIDDGSRPWRRWFAWRPVRVKSEWVWLEWITRCSYTAQGYRFYQYKNEGDRDE